MKFCIFCIAASVASCWREEFTERENVTDAGLKNVRDAVVVTHSIAPHIAWENVAGAERYEIEMRSGADFSDASKIVLQDTTPVARFVPAGGLSAGDYAWRARPAGTDAWTAGGRLRVEEPQKVFEIPPDADAARIGQIVAEAAAASPARVLFPENGEFRFDAPPVLMQIKDAQGLVVDGRGSTIVFTTPMSGFARIQDSHEVSLKNFIINHDPPPFTVGVVRTADQKTRELVIEIEPGLPDLDAPHILEDWGFCMLLENEPPGRVLDGSPLVPGLDKNSLHRVEGGFAIRANQSIPAEFLLPGVRIVQFARKGNARSLVLAERVSDLAILGITNHSISGGHYLALESDRARILGCRSVPAAGRPFGGNADGVHVRSSRVGPWIEGCHFEAIGDDGVAIFAKGIAVKKQLKADVLELDEKFFQLAVGDKIQVFNPRKGIPVGGILTIREIPSVGGGHRVVFEPALKERVETSFAEAWQNDQVFSMSARHSGFVVRRNVFRDVRRYGVIARGENGVIEENIFSGVTDSAITLQNEPGFWRNGLHSVGVVIRANEIERCNFSATATGRGVIDVRLRALADVNEKWGNRASAWRGHRNILIQENKIADWSGIGIFADNIEGLRIEKNIFSSERPSAIGATAIKIGNVADLHLAENDARGLREGTPSVAERD